MSVNVTVNVHVSGQPYRKAHFRGRPGWLLHLRPLISFGKSATNVKENFSQNWSLVFLKSKLKV